MKQQGSTPPVLQTLRYGFVNHKRGTTHEFVTIIYDGTDTLQNEYISLLRGSIRLRDFIINLAEGYAILNNESLTIDQRHEMAEVDVCGSIDDWCLTARDVFHKHGFIPVNFNTLKPEHEYMSTKYCIEQSLLKDIIYA
jgi:hypothetical protein